MKRLFKWVGVILLGLVLLVAVGAVVVYMMSNARFSQVYTVDPAPVTIPQPDSTTLARGVHVATIRGCFECHGEQLGGQVFMDDPALGTLLAANLTSGRGGVGGRYEEIDWVRSIRHGVDPAGRPLLFMPSHEFYYMGDEDIGALIAYLRQVPPVDNEQPASSVGPLGRLLFLLGELPLVPAELIAHDTPPPSAPPPGLTVAYGAYLGVTCTGCHGEHVSGGPIPGGPPDWPPAANLTTHETGLATWSEEDFRTLLRTGTRPDGTEVNTAAMPVGVLSKMTDEEIGALWLYLQSVPPQPAGNR